jgi:2'-5' RNA ligase
VLGGRDKLRLVPRASLHITLAFLGWRPKEEVPTLTEAALGAVGGLDTPRLEPVRLVPVPPRRPRLLALDLSDPGGRTSAVQGAVSGALSAAGLFTPEKRPFWPHLTLARVRGAGQRRGKGGPFTEPPAAEVPAWPMVFPRVTLYRSHLSRGGARYEPLAVRDLPE